MNFKIILDSLKTALNISDFVAKLRTLDREFIELRTHVNALTQRVDELEKAANKIKSKPASANKARPLPVKGKDFIHHNNLLWFKNDPTPYCPTCFGDSAKRIPMQIITTSIATTRYRPPPSKSYYCPKCKYEAEITTPPEF